MNEFKIEIWNDDGYESPREWDNLGRMGCVHRRYSLGDDEASKYLESVTDYNDSWDECEKQMKKEAIEFGDPIALILPLSLYDHSGISMSVGTSRGWDCGVVGFIWVTRKDLQREFKCKNITKKILERAEQVLRSEVETYSQYLEGDVWGFTIEDEYGELVDSCGGFYGQDDCRKEAESQVEYFKSKNVREVVNLIDKLIAEGNSRRTAC